MRIIVKGKNVEVNDALRNYVLKKVQRVDRYFNNIQDGLVSLSMERGRFKAETTMQVSGAILRAEEQESDMYAAIDKMAEKLERQVKRHKEKITSKGKMPMEEAFRAAMPPAPPEEQPAIVRTKRFNLKPMEPEEAVEQMELIGHTFFVFRNSANSQVTVVYKRRDGDYGLIEPEMD